MEIEKFIFRSGESKEQEDNSFQIWFIILLALLLIGDDKLLQSNDEELKRYAELLQKPSNRSER